MGWHWQSQDFLSSAEQASHHVFIMAEGDAIYYIKVWGLPKGNGSAAEAYRQGC
ncbi:MAG: hypothetical protein IKY72_05700 [Bacteroidaceae bacterium]|nr:hypothetical protein [Bacteroidaceae bacterium]